VTPTTRSDEPTCTCQTGEVDGYMIHAPDCPAASGVSEVERVVATSPSGRRIGASVPLYARDVVEGALRASPYIKDGVATAGMVVEALVEAGLLSKCICPVGFGQVARPDCPVHGATANHTITGAEHGETRVHQHQRRDEA
jgi:hypothetical protein